MGDAAIRALRAKDLLMKKDHSEWSYKDYTELVERTKKFRERISCPESGPTWEYQTEINTLLWDNGIGILEIKSPFGKDWCCENPIQVWNPPASSERRVEHYVLWSVQENASGKGWYDILAKRVGQDDFKLLFTREEAEDLYDKCSRHCSSTYGEHYTPAHKLEKKMIRLGKEIRIHALPTEERKQFRIG